MRPTIVSLGAAALVAVTAAAPLAAQRETPRESPREFPREQRDQPPRERDVEPLIRILGGADLAPDRAVVGITLGEATPRGIRVDEVAEGGPAAQAGIRAGDHLTAVGDVSLRLDPADADDPVLRTTSERRLRRALARVEAGNELTLRVASGDAERAVRVRTVRADALEPERDARRGAATIDRLLGAAGRDADRATIGVTLGSTGSARDTLGAFVLSVAEGGPAERAGIHEGARIAMIDDVDVRVPAADVDDEAIASRRASRGARAPAAARRGRDAALAGRRATAPLAAVAADAPAHRLTRRRHARPGRRSATGARVHLDGPYTNSRGASGKRLAWTARSRRTHPSVRAPANAARQGRSELTTWIRTTTSRSSRSRAGRCASCTRRRSRAGPCWTSAGRATCSSSATRWATTCCARCRCASCARAASAGSG